MARIYLSSTSNDLREYRKAAYETLRKFGHDVIGMETDLGPGAPVNANLDGIAQSDLYIGILAWQYGFIPSKDNRERLSFTEIEYRYAVRVGIPTLIFMLGEDAPWPSSFIDKEDEIRAFRERIRKQTLTHEFTSIETFMTSLAQNVREWERYRAKPLRQDGRLVGERWQEPVTRSRAPEVPLTLENLPLAWRLVVDFKAEPDLLRHLDPAAFSVALDKWEKEKNANQDLPMSARLEFAKKHLEIQQSGHAPSELWLAWMRATRPISVAVEPNAPPQASAPPRDYRAESSEPGLAAT